VIVIQWMVLELAALSLLCGCASPAKQTEALLSANARLAIAPSAYEIKSVPFIQQSAGHCGPAVMAMALEWAGKKIPLERLNSQIYTPGMNGSLQTDMLSAARRQGMIAIQIQGLENLLKEVAAGHPVVVFENLALSWAPQWHYAIVIGYDLTQKEILMHSGPEPYQLTRMDVFERSWMLADYWGLLVLPPDQLSVTASELDHVRAAAVLESLQKYDEADTAYKKILTRWPKSLAALIGLGNIAYENHNYVASEKYLRLATQYHPDSKAAWHNLAIAQKSAR
jgi:tetratricopeptide (TPR) repeat protein